MEKSLVPEMGPCSSVLNEWTLTSDYLQGLMVLMAHWEVSYTPRYQSKAVNPHYNGAQYNMVLPTVQQQQW